MSDAPGAPTTITVLRLSTSIAYPKSFKVPASSADIFCKRLNACVFLNIRQSVPSLSIQIKSSFSIFCCVRIFASLIFSTLADTNRVNKPRHSSISLIVRSVSIISSLTLISSTLKNPSTGAVFCVPIGNLEESSSPVSVIIKSYKPIISLTLISSTDLFKVTLN